jgi:AAA family ATP:ADP antiporter
MQNQSTGFLARLLDSVAGIKPEERRATLTAFLGLFGLMCGYYILRPVRDAMASDWSDAEVSFLWTLNFFVSTGAVAVYGWVMQRCAPRKVVLGVYSLFALSFLGATFFLKQWQEHPIWIDKGLYLWVSVFGLFNVTVFWSYVSDLFTKEQATRLFAIIGAGASAGALVGPAIPALLATELGIHWLLLLASTLFLLCVPLLASLQSTGNARKEEASETQEPSRLGGGALSGFGDFVRNPYLLAIGCFIILYTAVATFAYFQQKNLLVDYTRAERSQILGAVDWLVNALTFSIAFFATSRLVRYMGMPVALSCVPFLMAAAFGILVFAPHLAVVLLLQIVRRTGAYAIVRPAREMLFTLVSRAERFKAKPVIDVVCYRGGDMVTSWLFSLLSQGLGLGLAAMAACGTVVATLWGSTAIYLGRRFDADEAS